MDLCKNPFQTKMSKVVAGEESTDIPLKLFTKKEKVHKNYMHLKVMRIFLSN